MPLIRSAANAWRSGLLAIALALAGGAATAADPAPMNRGAALQSLASDHAAVRLAAVLRLGQVGQMADTDRLVERLRDDDPTVRDAAGMALWSVWGRSGDAAIDRLYRLGLQQMDAGDWPRARDTFGQIIRRKPSFAEGWNKRATVLFMMGELEASLKDCEEVLKRNPRHFGVLSGFGQIHLQLGHPEQALAYFERALEVNPNLDGIAAIIPVLRQSLSNRAGSRT